MLFYKHEKCWNTLNHSIGSPKRPLHCCLRSASTESNSFRHCKIVSPLALWWLRTAGTLGRAAGTLVRTAGTLATEPESSWSSLHPAFPSLDLSTQPPPIFSHAIHPSFSCYLSTTRIYIYNYPEASWSSCNILIALSCRNTLSTPGAWNTTFLKSFRLLETDVKV